MLISPVRGLYLFLFFLSHTVDGTQQIYICTLKKSLRVFRGMKYHIYFSDVSWERKSQRRADIIITPEEGFELLIFMGARLRSGKILIYNTPAQGRQQVLWNIWICSVGKKMLQKNQCQIFEVIKTYCFLKFKSNISWSGFIMLINELNLQFLQFWKVQISQLNFVLKILQV
jgi:hypothetical protein